MPIVTALETATARISIPTASPKDIFLFIALSPLKNQRNSDERRPFGDF